MFKLPPPFRSRFAVIPAAATVAALRGARALALWGECRRARRKLIALSDRALHDLGISRADAWGEYGKPFWRS